MPLTPEEYAAAAQAMGGTGAAFLPQPTQTPVDLGDVDAPGFVNARGDATSRLHEAMARSVGLPAFAQNYMASTPVDPATTEGPLRDALAATGRPQGATPPPPPDRDVRQFGYAGEPTFRPQPERPRGKGEHSSTPRGFKATGEDIGEEPATTATAGQPQGTPQTSAPIATMHPGGWSDTASPIRRSTYEQQRAALEGMGEAEAQYGVAQRLGNAERAAFMAEETERAERRIADARAREQIRALSMELQNRELDKAIAEANDAKVTREGFIERNPGSILMAVGAAIGGALRARTGLPNESLKALDNTMQEDLQLQREAANRKDKAVDRQHNLISMMRTRFGDERQADLAAEMAQRGLVGMHLDRLDAKAKDRETEAKIGIVKADNDQKLADLKAKWDQLTHYNAFTTGGSQQLKSEDQGRLMQLEDGRTVMAPRAEEATKAREQQVVVRDLERMATQINKLRDDPEAYVPFTTKRGRLKELGTSFVDAVRLAGKSGTLDKGFAEQAVERFGDPVDPTSHFGDRVSEFSKRARTSYEDQIRTWGGEQVQRGYTATPQGLKPTATFTGNQVNPRPPKTVPRQGVK